jgi:hypothetical protein
VKLGCEPGKSKENVTVVTLEGLVETAKYRSIASRGYEHFYLNTLPNILSSDFIFCIYFSTLHTNFTSALVRYLHRLREMYHGIQEIK